MKNRNRWFVGTAPALLAMAFAPYYLPSALADALPEEPLPYAQIMCDQSKAEVTISAGVVFDVKDLPTTSDTKSLYDLMEIRREPQEVGVEQDFLVPKGTFEKNCAIGKSSYRVIVTPWKAQERLNGMCGGDPPNLQLDVLKDGRPLINHFVFGGYCTSPDSDVHISRVTLSERRRVAEIVANGAEIRLPYSAILNIDRTTLIESRKK